jgi:cephalosporin-C deacetylase-like acetyl esterase
MMSLDINAHGLPNGEPKEYYDSLYGKNGKLSGYQLFGRESREETYFLNMFLRMLRAIDFLTSQPEWDGKTLVVYGASQGGYQAITAAALDARVSYFVAGVPAGCDHSGMMANRISGWPKWVTVVNGKPDEKMLQAARYFDAMNFATRIQVPGFVTVGFIDTTCPPTSVYAAYNNLHGPKEIYNDVGARHENTPEAVRRMMAAIAAHIAKQKS